MKPQDIPHDDLFELERKIARRADELSRQHGYDPSHALEHWRRAEREVWDDVAARELDSEHGLHHARSAIRVRG